MASQSILATIASATWQVGFAVACAAGIRWAWLTWGPTSIAAPKTFLSSIGHHLGATDPYRALAAANASLLLGLISSFVLAYVFAFTYIQRFHAATAPHWCFSVNPWRACSAVILVWTSSPLLSNYWRHDEIQRLRGRLPRPFLSLHCSNWLMLMRGSQVAYWGPQEDKWGWRYKAITR